MDEQELTTEEAVIDAAKIAKIQKEKQRLLDSLAGGDFSKQKTKVAYILNLYPDSRNSDVTLALRYWQTFQSDIYNPNGILPQDLFKLERFHYLVRARAKIQNEYKLFVPNSEIQRFRRQHEETMTDEVLQDSAPRSVMNVFADESGKTQDYVIVASVWVLSGRAVYTISQAISQWKEKSVWKGREIHFSNMGARDIEPLAELLGVVLQNREFLSFKTIAVERKRTKRTINEVVEKLHENMLIRGANHEVLNQRVQLPQSINVTVDQEQSLDAITLEELKRRVNTEYSQVHGDKLKVASLDSISSKISPLVQLADIIAGAINRKLNTPDGRNFKDDMAEMVIQMLDLNLSEIDLEGLDSSALFKL